MRHPATPWPRCPNCDEMTRQQNVAWAPGETPSRATPFITGQPSAETPAFGCEHCGTQYGNWLEEFADGV